MASYGPAGKWLALETAIIEGRQNGKTKSVLLTMALADLFLFNLEPDRIVWTSHIMKTTLDVFEVVKKIINSYSDLSRRVKFINESKSEESIVLMDGSQMDFIARGDNKGRGLSGKRVVFDEAMFLVLAMMGALMPTLSARYNPQLSYGSSAGKPESDFLRSLQKRGRRGNDPSLILIEYRAPGGWDNPPCGRGLDCDHIFENPQNEVWDRAHRYFGCAMDKEEHWMMANHAILAGRIQISFIRAERRTLCQNLKGVLEFGRERMGWEELGENTLDPDRIPKSLWERQFDDNSEIEGRVCFALDIPPSAGSATICVGGRRPDGDIHFGVVDQRSGIMWAPDRLKELTSNHETMCPPLWTPNAAVPVGAMREALRKARVPMEDVSQQGYAEACGSLKAHIDTGDVWHRRQQSLDTAFEAHVRRVQIEGGWTFARRHSAGDISPMVGSALVVQGVDKYGATQPGAWIL
jgi:hypothetical protein